MGDWLKKAEADARECVVNYMDTVCEMARNGEVSNDLLNDYPNGDSYHHEAHVDYDYDLIEAGEILRELGEWEETDSGLWQGMEPRRGVAAQAAYTYGNCVYHKWQELVEELNRVLTDWAADTAADGNADKVYEGVAWLWVQLACDLTDYHDPHVRGMARGAADDLEDQRLDGAKVLADYLQDHDDEAVAGEIREAVALVEEGLKVEEGEEEPKVTTWHNMTTEHLGNHATDADLGRFRDACRAYQTETGADDYEATEFMWNGGDWGSRVADYART
jgi:hypothetical protein